MITGLYDIYNLTRKLSFRKIRNGVLLVVGFFYSTYTRRENQWGKPISISIEPTTSCNLRCPECPSGLRSFTRNTGMLSQELFKKIIDENYKDLLYLILYFQGEPYLHKELFYLIKYANQHKIYTATSTNAHYLDEENAKKTIESGLDRLIISIDGTTQDTYEQYRVGGQLEKVIKGTRELIKWKNKLRSKTPQIYFQFLVVRPNEHQVDEVKKLAKEIGVDKVLFKTAQIYNFEKGSPLIPVNQMYSRYQQNESGTYELKNKLLNRCWKMWHSCVVTWDGFVVPCCFDKDAKHKFGNVKYHPLNEIWINKSYKNFRSSLLTSRKEIDICKNCTEGTKIWA